MLNPSSLPEDLFLFSKNAIAEFLLILAPYNKQTLKFRQDGDFLNITKDQPGRVQILQGVHPPGGQQEEGGLHRQKHLAVGLHAKHPSADRNHHDVT